MFRPIYGLVLLCLCGNAWAESLWVRPVNDCAGSPCVAANGSDYDNAFDGWADIAWGAGAGAVTAGDTLFVCGTHTQSGNRSIGGSGTGVGAEITIDGACLNGAAPVPGILTTTSGYPLYPGNHSWVIIQNLTINTGTANQHCIFTGNGDNVTITENHIGPCLKNAIFMNSSTIEDNWTITNNTFDTWNSGTTGGGRAIYYVFTAVSSVVTGWTITGNTFVNGMYDDSADANGGGGIRFDISTGWETSTFTNMTISNNTFTNLASAAIQVNCSASHTWDAAVWCTGIVIDGNTMTNVSSSTLTGHLGAIVAHNLDGARITNNVIDTARVAGAGIQYEGGINGYIAGNSVSNITSGNGIDGQGIYADQRSHDNTYERNYVSGCDNTMPAADAMGGAGFHMFRAWDNTFVGNVVVNCARGITFNGAETTGNVAYNNTLIGNGSAWEGVAQGFLTIDAPTTAAAFKNNIITGFAVGVRVAVGNDLAVWDYNLLYNNTANYTVQTPGGNDITADPKLTGSTVGNLMLQATSPARLAGTYVGPYTDYRNCQYKNPPSIGAYEVCSGDAASARTAAAARTAASARTAATARTARW